MAVQLHAKFKGREEVSPERTKVWTEPNKKIVVDKKVPVVYYLCRNGHLDQPHFIEVPLSSPDGLYLKDVINRLNLLRGKGVASMYSWSSKRSYKRGFVWHDLTETDLIRPAHNNEYILKGSEIVEPSRSTLETTSFREELPTQKLNSEFPVITHRRNQSWSTVNLNEYRVYKSNSVSELSRKFNSDASTQTDERRRRKKPIIEELNSQQEVLESTELGRGEISPPQSDSSPETLESLMKAGGRLVLYNNGKEECGNCAVESCSRGSKMKASSILMQLLSCGSMSFRDCGALAMRDQGMPLIGRANDGVGNEGGKEAVTRVEMNGFSGMKLEDKEYFSGSLIETKKDKVPTIKRSSSYNADRSSQVQMVEKDMDGVRAMCIPRRPKSLPTKKEGSIINSFESCATKNGQQGNTRLDSLQEVDIGAK